MEILNKRLQTNLDEKEDQINYLKNEKVKEKQDYINYLKKINLKYNLLLRKTKKNKLNLVKMKIKN